MSFKNLGVTVFLAFSLQIITHHMVYAADKHNLAKKISFSATIKKAVNQRGGNSQDLCFYVLPVGGRDKELGELLLSSLERYLSGKLPSIVRAPAESYYVSGEVKPSFPDNDWEAKYSRCPFLFAFTEIVAEKLDFVFWAKKSLFVEIKLFSLSDNQEIWAERHAVQRDSGGFPLSPVSSILDVRQVSNFKANKDLTPSMVDDLMRELTKTIAFAR